MLMFDNHIIIKIKLSFCFKSFFSLYLAKRDIFMKIELKNPTSFIELIKYIGLLSMTLDHVGVLFFKYEVVFRMFGRLAFPLFAFVLVYNYLYNTKNKEAYIKRIAIAAVLFEPIHHAVFNAYSAGLNIFFLFALALSVIYVFELVIKDKRIVIKKAIFLFVYAGIAIFASTYTEYYMSGLLLTISIYLALKKPNLFFLPILFLVILNSPHPIFMASTLAVLPVLILSTKVDTQIYRYKYFFYAYYPLHMLALGVLSSLM